MNGLRWGQGIKSTTHRRVEEFGYSCLQRRLTWAKEKKNWTVAQWSKVLFSDESKFCISFGNQGPRVWRKGGEAHTSCWRSSVKFAQSVMIWGAMSSAGVSPLCFLQTNVTAPVNQDILEHFMLPSADQLFKDADFIFQQDLAPAHTAKSTKSWLNDQQQASKLTRPEHRESMGYCQEENEKQETKTCRWAEGHCQRNLGFIPPQQCHKLITSMPRRIEYICSTWTYFPEGQQLTNNVFLLVLWSILICWDSELVGFCSMWAKIITI